MKADWRGEPPCSFLDNFENLNLFIYDRTGFFDLELSFDFEEQLEAKTEEEGKRLALERTIQRFEEIISKLKNLQ